MGKGEIRYPEISGEPDEEQLLNQIQEWVLNNAGSLNLNEAMAPMVGELFVPYRYSYDQILRTWLKVHAVSQKRENEISMRLVEIIIEKTVVQQTKTRKPRRDSG